MCLTRSGGNLIESGASWPSGRCSAAAARAAAE
jgi:hypothetical protein